MSAVSGEGVKELLYYVNNLIKEQNDEPVIFAQEFFPEVELLTDVDPAHTVTIEDGVFVVEGPQIEKMLGYTNIESEKGFLFFQNFLKEKGILKELKDAGINEGDTVRMYGWEFDYYE